MFIETGLCTEIIIISYCLKYLFSPLFFKLDYILVKNTEPNPRGTYFLYPGQRIANPRLNDDIFSSRSFSHFIRALKSSSIAIIIIQPSKNITINNIVILLPHLHTKDSVSPTNQCVSFFDTAYGTRPR